MVKQPRDFRGGKDSLGREVVEHTLKQVIYILQEVSSQEYASIAIKIGE